MFERLPIVLGPRRPPKVGGYVLDGRFQPVQAIVHPPEVLLGDDHLPRRDLE
jgi:hypothetical protein